MHEFLGYLERTGFAGAPVLLWPPTLEFTAGKLRWLGSVEANLARAL